MEYSHSTLFPQNLLSLHSQIPAVHFCTRILPVPISFCQRNVCLYHSIVLPTVSGMSVPCTETPVPFHFVSVYNSIVLPLCMPPPGFPQSPPVIAEISGGYPPPPHTPCDKTTLVHNKICLLPIILLHLIPSFDISRDFFLSIPFLCCDVLSHSPGIPSCL